MMVIEASAESPEKPTLLVQNIFTDGTVTSSATATDGAAGNALGDGTFDYWTGSTATSSVTVDMGSAVYCDGFGVAAHTLGTAGASIEVQSSPDNATWTTRATAEPLTDETIFAVFPLTLARYWRVRVLTGPASVGVIKLGRRIIIPTGVILGHVGVNHAERIELLSNDSIDGQFLGTRVIRKSGNIDLDFGLIDREFVENDMAMFEAMYNEGRTFFYAGSPVNLPKDLGYCKRPANGSEMRPPYEGGSLMQLDFEAQVYVG